MSGRTGPEAEHHPEETAARTLAVITRLALVVAAMAQDTPFHDQMFDIVADLETLMVDGEQRSSHA